MSRALPLSVSVPVTPTDALERTVAFLNEIGLPCHFVPGANGFLPHVRIDAGELLVDPMAPPSDVLHEAGHLATLPGRFRPFASDDIDGVLQMMSEQVDFSDPDTGEGRAALQCSDTEATAWAWAAGVAIGLEPDEIIAGSSYGGEGEDIRSSLSCNMYMGINGLSAAGFCVVRPGALEKYRSLPAFPKLARWLQPDFGLPPPEPPGRKRFRPS